HLLQTRDTPQILGALRRLDGVPYPVQRASVLYPPQVTLEAAAEADLHDASPRAVNTSSRPTRSVWSPSRMASASASSSITSATTSRRRSRCSSSASASASLSIWRSAASVTLI